MNLNTIKSSAELGIFINPSEYQVTNFSARDIDRASLYSSDAIK